jgi:sirohydrochlorin cobaltochelatase
MTALVLAGHGSHVSPDTAGLVWSYVDQLRAWGVTDEITAGFWKESPGFSQVLDTVEAEQIVVVPVFTARGFFSTRVIPAEMGLTGAITTLGARTIYYTRTLGEHPYLSQIVRQRVADTIDQYALDRQQCALAIIGHGTQRNPQSRSATRQQVAQLQHLFPGVEVVDAYLDDEPDIASIYDRTQAHHIIAVPFFLAPGSHVTLDVPTALGLQPQVTPSRVQGREVYYTPPVGTDDAICHLILELARDTGLHFEKRPTQKPWTGFPHAGADLLLETLRAAGSLSFGQLYVTPTQVRPLTATESAQAIHNPTELRQRVRTQPFRPLPTTADLPNDWYVPVAAPTDVPAVVETVYPGALADWAANRRNDFQPESLAIVSARQVGMFQDIHTLSLEKQSEQVRLICGGCIRHATWFFGSSSSDSIPCKAPCNWWLSRVKEAAE